jgi:hypothetical protein
LKLSSDRCSSRRMSETMIGYGDIYSKLGHILVL